MTCMWYPKGLTWALTPNRIPVYDGIPLPHQAWKPEEGPLPPPHLQAEEQSVTSPTRLWEQEKDGIRNPAQRSSFLVMLWLFQRLNVTAG
ncbi:rCG40793 [Rattus norvegicus]|uniref:RCG40793 n=1 Tax=Rattus norvegicus TaxID=10116 RepID=A6KP15_RAT|nr:rCG40793 [Rattus norvegicus]